MHEDDIAIVISESTLSAHIDRVDHCVDTLRCVWLALQHDPKTLSEEYMVSVRNVLRDATRTIEEPQVWLDQRAA